MDYSKLRWKTHRADQYGTTYIMEIEGFDPAAIIERNSTICSIWCKGEIIFKYQARTQKLAKQAARSALIKLHQQSKGFKMRFLLTNDDKERVVLNFDNGYTVSLINRWDGSVMNVDGAWYVTDDASNTIQSAGSELSDDEIARLIERVSKFEPLKGEDDET